MSDFATFKGTADERLAWIKQQAEKLQDMMNDNLLVMDEDGDCDWLNIKDNAKGIDTHDTLDELNKFLIIVTSDYVPDFFEHKGFGPDGFID